MRTHSKPNAKPGHSKAAMYKCNLFSAATDIEALIDAYGEPALHQIIERIASDMRVHGDSIFNGQYNILLNALPEPKLRKKNATKAEQVSLRNAIEEARRVGRMKRDDLELKAG